MKFSLTSILLTVALVAVALGWNMSIHRNAEQLDLVRTQTREHLLRARDEAAREYLFVFAKDLTTGISYEDYKMGIATFLVSKFDQLARFPKEDGEDIFEDICLAGGEIIYHLGWDCSTPDELQSAVDRFSRRSIRDPPPILTKEFATKVLEAKTEFVMSTMGGQAVPDEPLIDEFYKMNDLFRWY